MFSFFKKKPTVTVIDLNDVCAKSQAFRDTYGFKIPSDSFHKGPLVMHDWLHYELGAPATKEGEKLVVEMEMHLLHPKVFKTKVKVPKSLYADYAYVNENLGLLRNVYISSM